MDLMDIQKRLNEFSQKLDLVNQALERCKEVIERLKLEDKEGDLDSFGGFDPAELIFEFNNQILMFNSFKTDMPITRTQIGIYIDDPDKVWARGLEPVGNYELDTNLDGEHIDDWLYFDKTGRNPK